MISIGDDSDFEIASSVCSSTQDDVVSPQGKGSSRSSGGTIYLTIGFDSLCPAGVSVTCQDDGPFPFSTLHVTRPRGLKQTVRFAVGPADRVPADGVKLKVNLFRDLTRCKQASDIHGQISHLRILPATSLPSTISTTSAAAGEQLQQQNASSPLRVELVRQALQYDAPQSGALSSSGCNDLLNQNDLEDDIKAGDHNLEKRRLLQLHSENKGGPQSGEEEHLWDMQEVFGVKNLDGGDSSEESGCAPCQEEMCIICMSDPRDTLVLPCRHMAFCTECAEVMRHQCEKCPICRQNVSSLLRFEREQPKEPAAATRSLMDI
ncbi:unnamed protein product [Amoebophrya sp. A25]|nr:unnamed protein product [Amoebophrya sp. A25]|eukprot:GSA25T00006349001.1